MKSTRTLSAERAQMPRLFTNALGIVFSLALALVGVLIFVVGSWFRATAATDAPLWAVATAEQVGGLMIATGILSLFWDLWGRRSLAAEVMAVADLAHEVRDAGLTHIWNRYLPEDTWRERFNKAHRIDIFVAYANTWRETYRNDLVQFSKRPGHSIRVILPDIKDPATITAIACRSGKTPDEVVAKVTDATSRYQEVLSEGLDCTILAHRGPQAYAAYRFDDECVLTLYRNHPKKTGHIPTMTISGGSLGTFVDDDLNAVISNSTLLWSSSSGNTSG